MERPEGQLAPRRPGTTKCSPPPSRCLHCRRSAPPAHAAQGGGQHIGAEYLSLTYNQIMKTCVDDLRPSLCKYLCFETLKFSNTKF
eukprot:2653915-Pleurochrysis_carterae.AAC.1